MSDILALSSWETNGDLMSDVAGLGYLPEPVIDLTYGRGNFWTEHRPAELTANDAHPERGEVHYDCRSTLFDTGQFAAVVFDPPYKLAGTPDSGAMDDAYGTDEARTRGEVLSLLVGGIAEGARLTSRYLLVKTQDQVSSGAVRWQTHAAAETARSLELQLVDSFIFPSYRPQPAGRRQVHARRNYSTLLVFRKGRK